MPKDHRKLERLTMLSPFEQSFYYYYFLVHIPVAIFIDSSVVVPERYQLIPKLVQWHIKQNNDFLLYEKPTWLRWFVIFELAVQVPAFFWFVTKFKQLWSLQDKDEGKESKAAYHKCSKNLNKWLRLYGLKASLTTLICMIVIWQRAYYPFGDFAEMSMQDKLKLISVYSTTFLTPLRLCFV